jgi:hypothetical protein
MPIYILATLHFIRLCEIKSEALGHQAGLGLGM